MTLGSNIRHFREQLGWSQEDLARAAGVPQSRISDLETGKTATSKQLPEIAQALKRQVGDLDERYRQNVAVGTKAALANVVNDMPVFAASDCGSGVITVSPNQIGRVPRPHTLEGIVDAYAVLIPDDTMAPAYEPGDRAWVNPHLPPLQGTDCILYAIDGDGSRATIVRLMTWTKTEWSVRQFSPPRDFKLNRFDWPKHHRVVGNFRRQ